MSMSRNPQHRKPGSATKAKSVAIRAAAIGAVPGAALSAHELAGQQSGTAPLQPLDDELLGRQTGDVAGVAADNPFASSPSEVQAALLRINERHEQAAADVETAAAGVETAAATQASKKPAAATVSYTVRDGDYLSQIAENYLGNASDYPEIYALNRDRVEPGGEHFTDPSVIMPGWTLTLPAGAKPGHADSISTSSATYSGSSSGSQRAYSASDVASTGARAPRPGRAAVRRVPPRPRPGPRPTAQTIQMSGRPVPSTRGSTRPSASCGRTDTTSPTTRSTRRPYTSPAATPTRSTARTRTPPRATRRSV